MEKTLGKFLKSIQDFKIMKKKLPIGIQSFEKIRTEECYYVDKTPFVARLVEEGTYYFLSRPRRFGKSLFLDTLKQAFLGRKELFSGLYLEQNWDWEQKYPVVHIDFSGGVVKDAEDLVGWILDQLRANQRTLKVECGRTDDYRWCFRELIIKAAETYNQKVVVLIDEYDKPILDRIEHKDEAITIREILKDFYSVLKPLDVYLKFVFITGVSKFSKVSLFSGLNQLRDITISEDYATICGYTQEELEKVFARELRGKDLEAIRCWYNGYSWLGDLVYNPFDVLLYLQENRFHPYWFESGTPNFLVKLLVQKRFYMPQFSELMASENLIGSFDVDAIEPENLLFQTGYLTIKGVEPIPTGYLYYLSYPNKEVRVALNSYIVSYLTQRGFEASRLVLTLVKGLKSERVEVFVEVLKALFASIPYEWYRSNEIANYEGYYASVVYSFFAGAGFDMIAEDYTSRGKIDLSIFYENVCYIMEFKIIEMDGGFPKAMEQIRNKKYHEKYIGRYKAIYLIGIDFSKNERNIVSFEWEKI